MKETINKTKYRCSNLNDRSVNHSCVRRSTGRGDMVGGREGGRSTGMERDHWSWDGDQMRAQQGSGFERKERVAMGTH